MMISLIMIRILALIFLLSLPLPSFAVTADMKFHGTLIEPPPCTIKSRDGGSIIDVAFGDRVGVNKVNGINYQQPVPYTFECDANLNDWGLTLEVVAETTLGNTAIKSNIEGFGIRILQNGEVFELNKPISISYENKPILTAVPVKDLEVSLQPEPFRATATLVAAYQ